MPCTSITRPRTFASGVSVRRSGCDGGGTTPVADRSTYFNGNPIMTLPDASRAAVGTDKLGLFAALNIKPGPVHVESAGVKALGDPLTTFGSFDAFVYANTVSIVTINGGKGTK